MTVGANNSVYSFFNNEDYLSIPRALIAYNSTMLYNSYLSLENQLSQIDPEQEPVIYAEIEQLTQTVFNSWVSLGYRVGGDYGTGI